MAADVRPALVSVSRRAFTCTGLGVASAVAAPASQGVPAPLRYPRPYGPLAQHDYTATLIREALRAAGESAPVEPSEQPMVQGRWLREVAQGGGVDIGWSVQGPRLGADLRVVPLPLCRGLFGWRLLMVRPNERERWAGVRRVEDLRGTRFAQGHEWVDTEILRSNGLQVVQAGAIENLYEMVKRGLADALPRAAAELSWELELQPSHLVLEPHLLLRYPAPLVFVVHPSRRDLAAALHAGLQALQASGQFERLFREHLLPDLRPWKLERRQVLHLHNPWLSAELPAADSGWWYQPLAKP